MEDLADSLAGSAAVIPFLGLSDTGLAAYLMGFGSPDALCSSFQAGALWKSYVVGQWVRRRDGHLRSPAGRHRPPGLADMAFGTVRGEFEHPFPHTTRLHEPANTSLPA
jgi:hypothetical protein